MKPPRPPNLPREQSPWSSQLRQWRNELQSGNLEATLRAVDATLARPQLPPTRAASALGLVGDALLAAGRFDEARRVFDQASRLAAPEPRLRMRLLISSARAELGAGDADAAMETALSALSFAVSQSGAFAAERRRQERNAAQERPAKLGPRPPGPAQVARRLSSLFVREGEPVRAEELLRRGLVRASARQAAHLAAFQARLHWQAGRVPETAAAAETALTSSRLTAAQISLLPLWLRARHTIGSSVSTAELDALWTKAPPGVRARALTSAVLELRALGDPRWRSLAERWVASRPDEDPRVAKDLRKQMLADALRGGDPEQARELTKTLLRASTLAEDEWLAVARARVRIEPVKRQEPLARALVDQAREKHGAEAAARVRHAIARDWVQTPEQASAGLEFLRLNASDPQVSSGTRRRALWVAGLAAARAGRHAEAAEAFGRIASAADTPTRFATLAQLRRLRALADAGDSRQLVALAAEVETALSRELEPFLALDLARALAGQHESLDDLATRLYESGRRRLLAAWAGQRAPDWRRRVLLQLARRETFEFRRFDRIVELWEGLPTAERSSLWSADDAYWEYQHLRLRALRRVKGEAATEAGTLKLLRDPATPPNGFAWIASAHAELLLRLNRPDEAIGFFKEILKTTPNHIEAETAAYWLTIDALGRKDADEVAALASRVLGLVGRRMETQQHLYRAIAMRLLTTHPRAENMEEVDPRMNAHWLRVSRDQINNDLRRLGYSNAL